MPASGDAIIRRPLFPAITCLILLTLLAYLAGKELLADIYLGIAYQESSVRDSRPADEKWRQAAKYFDDSLRYSPRNPYTLEALGTHEIAGMRSGADVSRSSTDILHSAIDRLRRALEERPTSPNAWANLALAKLFLSELDEELFRAIRHADELAPWESDIQRAVLITSLGAWNKLDATQQAVATRTVARAAQRDLPALGKLLQNFRRLDLLCEAGNSDAKVLDYCRSQPKPAAPLPANPRRSR